ncbi:hypothetical protein GFGA_1d0520 [Gluconobacter frateurii NBRC 103465]|nr:hypothetical protein GFGA_1d0520 [Gluconobacter frateurii NBRC 103465]
MSRRRIGDAGYFNIVLYCRGDCRNLAGDQCPAGAAAASGYEANPCWGCTDWFNFYDDRAGPGAAGTYAECRDCDCRDSVRCSDELGAEAGLSGCTTLCLPHSSGSALLPVSCFRHTVPEFLKKTRNGNVSEGGISVLSCHGVSGVG